MNTGIYKIVNLVNDKIYIGSASSKGGFRKRWNEHKSNLNRNKHHSKHLQSAWLKYGEKSFLFEIIEIVDTNILEKEQFYLDTLQPEYNTCKIAGNTFGIKLTQKQKNNLSNLGKLKVGSKNPFYNKKHSDQTKELQSKIRKESHQKNGHPRLGMKHSEETKRLQSEAKAGFIPINKVPVYQLNLRGEVIKFWESASLAARELNLQNANITNACKGRLKTTGGFKWKYV